MGRLTDLVTLRREVIRDRVLDDSEGMSTTGLGRRRTHVAGPALTLITLRSFSDPLIDRIDRRCSSCTAKRRSGSSVARH
jgi:hypothetical protein